MRYHPFGKAVEVTVKSALDVPDFVITPVEKTICARQALTFPTPTLLNAILTSPKLELPDFTKQDAVEI
jgi:hypothetical protein